MREEKLNEFTQLIKESYFSLLSASAIHYIVHQKQNFTEVRNELKQCHFKKMFLFHFNMDL